MADGNGGTNYTVSFVAGTAGSITVRPITVTAVANTKTYDGTTTAAATPTITGGLGAGDTAAFHETYDNANVGSGKTLTPAGSVNDGNGGANYTVSFAANTTGEIVTQLNDPYVSLSDGIGASFTAGQGTWVQVPIRLDNLQDGSGDVGLRNATVEVSFSSTAYLAGAPAGPRRWAHPTTPSPSPPSRAQLLAWRGGHHHRREQFFFRRHLLHRLGHQHNFHLHRLGALESGHVRFRHGDGLVLRSGRGADDRQRHQQSERLCAHRRPGSAGARHGLEFRPGPRHGYDQDRRQ